MAKKSQKRGRPSTTSVRCEKCKAVMSNWAMRAHLKECRGGAK